MKSTLEIGSKVLSSDLLNWVDAFLFDRRSSRLSERTLQYYRDSLTNFLKYCTSQMVSEIEQVDALLIRKYLLHLEVSHNPGGVHAKYRAVKAFFRWYEREIDDPEYRNPMNKVRLKPVRIDPLEPADVGAVRAMLDDCKRPIPFHPAWLGLRDRLIILMLLDTGLRAAELLSLTVDNVDPITGLIHLQEGKGGKPRPVFISRLTRQTYRKYLKDVAPDYHLILSEKRERMTYSGIRSVLESRSSRAGVPYQTPHSFRRLCALTLYRSTGDIYAVQRYLGHISAQTTLRYLKLTEDDARKAHIKGSPVEELIS